MSVQPVWSKLRAHTKKNIDKASKSFQHEAADATSIARGEVVAMFIGRAVGPDCPNQLGGTSSIFLAHVGRKKIKPYRLNWGRLVQE